MLTIYGIKNCSTMKKAFNALDDAGIGYEFFDYKKQDVSTEDIEKWVDGLGVEKVLNKRGTTWRKQSDEDKVAADADVAQAIALMVANPSMIKRPILEGIDSQGHHVLIAGFDEDTYAGLAK